MAYIVSVPFHVFISSRSARRIGLDAYFWPSLSNRRNVVFLARRVELLSLNSEGMVLPIRVAASEQLRELNELAVKPLIPRPQGLLDKLISLVLPPKLLWRGLSNIESESIASWTLASELVNLGLEPTGEVAWLNLRLGPGGRPLGDKLYEALYERDEGFRREVERLVTL